MIHEPPFAAVDRWDGGWDETGLGEWCEGLRARLGSRAVTFGMLFTTPEYFDRAKELLEIVRVHARVPLLVGCSSPSLVAGGREYEDGRGLVLSLHALPGGSVKAFVLPPGEVDATGHVRASGLELPAVSGWLAFLEPFHTDAEAWMESWQAAFPGRPIYGGLAAGPGMEPRAQVYLDGEVIEQGGVVLAVSGVRMVGIVAQGCSPVGEVWTVTRVEGNIVHRIGNRPAVAVLEETFTGLSEEVRRRSRGNFFAGLVVDEYQEEHQRGDFLVRNIVGADPDSGVLALGAFPRQGQTLQFQMRDAAGADEEIRELLGRLRDRIGRAQIFGGCLCVCNGRGNGLFGEPDHDAGLVQQIVGPHAVSGFFCNGELGPIGPKSFVHGYTASLVLFVGPPRGENDEL